MPIRDFEDLIAWQKSVDLITAVYRLTRQFPAEERYGLTSQLRKAAVSVASNIAEGNGRGTTKDYIHFLHTSRGSLYETRSLLIVSDRLQLASISRTDPVFLLADEVGRTLSGLHTSLRKRL